jgi:UPF0755 protein
MTEMRTLRPARPPGHRERRGKGLIVLLALIVILAIAAVILGRMYSYATGASGPRTPITVEIDPGSTGAEVADLLVSRHVIRSAWAFKLMARFKHSGDFQAGRYELTTNMTVSQAIAALEEGPVVETVRLTIPEGYRVSQAATRVAETLDVTAKQYTAEAESGRYTLAPYVPKGTQTLEGFLFPDTYFFFKDSDAAAVVRRQLDQFKTEADKLGIATKAQALGITPYQVVVVASLIEEEVRFDADRAKVAAVIYNRLKKGMPLQFDTTIQYALPHPKPSLTTADLKIDSPYNTYLHRGLPPTPLSSPGIASLSAALNPAAVDYLYVVTDKSGHGHFTASYAEFLTLKAQYT